MYTRTGICISSWSSALSRSFSSSAKDSFCSSALDVKFHRRLLHLAQQLAVLDRGLPTDGGGETAHAVSENPREIVELVVEAVPPRPARAKVHDQLLARRVWARHLLAVPRARASRRQLRALEGAALAAHLSYSAVLRHRPRALQRLAHDGNPLFSDHVLSASQRVKDNGWTLSKGKSKRKIDAVIALAIAADRATTRPVDSPEPGFFVV